MCLAEWMASRDHLNPTSSFVECLLASYSWSLKEQPHKIDTTVRIVYFNFFSMVAIMPCNYKVSFSLPIVSLSVFLTQFLSFRTSYLFKYKLTCNSSWLYYLLVICCSWFLVCSCLFPLCPVCIQAISQFLCLQRNSSFVTAIKLPLLAHPSVSRSSKLYLC